MNELIEQVLMGFKFVRPDIGKYLNINVGGRHRKYLKNFENVTKFLLEFKGNKRKNITQMGIDYFTCLLNYYRGVLRLNGFRLSHIDSKKAIDLYKKYINIMGESYWDIGKEIEGRRPEWLSPVEERDIRNEPLEDRIPVYSSNRVKLERRDKILSKVKKFNLESYRDNLKEHLNNR